MLANDKPGPVGVGDESSVDSLTIIGVGGFDKGGSATFTASTVRYTPKPDFWGTESFTYTVQDIGGEQATATVTVTVTNVNDAPIAMDDLVFVDEFTTDNQLNLLADNGSGADKPGPDNEAADDLRIIGLGPSNLQTITTPFGTVSISAGGKSVLYTPDPEVEGLEIDTFVYTLSDGTLTDTATVTVNIEPVVRPRARNDSQRCRRTPSTTRWLSR